MQREISERLSVTRDKVRYVLRKSRLKNFKYKRVCKNCGKEYETIRHQSKFCSESCRGKYNRRNRGHERECEQCGKVFYKYKEQRFCTDICYNKHVKENSMPKVEWKTAKDYYIPKPKKVKVCVNCNEEYKMHAPDGKYCSYECRLEYNQKQREVYNKKCKECGKWFSTTNRIKFFCSTGCKDKSHYRKKETIRRERILKNGRVDWDISIERLMKRDKGVCHLCGNKVNLNLDTNDDYYGSVDHVRPISKGGTHTWENVKLAHRICNSYKSDETEQNSEQLALL